MTGKVRTERMAFKAYHQHQVSLQMPPVITITQGAPVAVEVAVVAPVAEAVAEGGAAPHEMPAGKSSAYDSAPVPNTNAPVMLASLRKVVGLVAGRKRTVPGTAVSGGVGGVKSALQNPGRQCIVKRH